MRLGALARAQKEPGAPTSTRWSGRSKGVAIVTAALLGAGGSILAAAPATAAPVASTGQGRFLSGSALGVNLDDILTVTPANAVNSGGATDTDVHPLDVTALNAVNVDLGGGLNLLGNNGILTLGAVNQYAAANADGSSVAASGAVTNTGGIGVGGQDGVPQSNATSTCRASSAPTWRAHSRTPSSRWAPSLPPLPRQPARTVHRRATTASPDSTCR